MIRATFYGMLFLSIIGCTTISDSLEDNKFSIDWDFDHTYVITDSNENFRNLLANGFTPYSKPTRHSGLLCRYIHFRPVAASWSSYLEFCEITDPVAFEASDSEVKRLYQSNRIPGISFRTHGTLRESFDRLKTREDNSVKYDHKNYEWYNDEKAQFKDRPLRPGWNFLTFENPINPTIYIWATEYEPKNRHKKTETNRSVLYPAVEHINTVYDFGGFIMRKSKTPSKLKKLLIKGDEKQFYLGGREIDFVDKNDEIYDTLRSKKSDYLAVVLLCKDLNRFISIANPDLVATFEGKRAAIIKQNDLMWDLVIVEGKSL